MKTYKVLFRRKKARRQEYVDERDIGLALAKFKAGKFGEYEVISIIEDEQRRLQH